VARFAIEEPEEGHGDAHTCEHTLGVYTEQLDIGRLWIEGCPACAVPGAWNFRDRGPDQTTAPRLDPKIRIS
jgi:hypothetical protein